MRTKQEENRGPKTGGKQGTKRIFGRTGRGLEITKGWGTGGIGGTKKGTKEGRAKDREWGVGVSKHEKGGESVIGRGMDKRST